MPVRGDRTYVEQVVRNLVGNSAKYGGSSGPIEVRMTGGQDEVVVRILDRGPGFPPDVGDRLFDLYYRAPGAAGLASGAGIGLFVCKRLIEAMGGRDRVRRSTGRWGGVRVRAPHLHRGGDMTTQPLILVADDEPRITKLVAITLGDEGFRVVTANGGEDALRKAEEVRPDIVLLDIVMPDLDGIEVMRQLQESRHVPVILLTAKGATSDKAKGLDLGADDYIAKPFHPDELAARVRAVLRRSNGAAAASGVVHIGRIDIDLERRMMTTDGELVPLSRTEWLLLAHLAANAGRVVLHSELLTKVWGPEYRDDLQYLRVRISRVRRKLGAAPGEPGPITTFQGIGYVLNVDEPPPLAVVEDHVEG